MFSNPRTVSDELACILPHIQMISTLMSIVENVEVEESVIDNHSTSTLVSKLAGTKAFGPAK
jgi:hypothetical protein